MCQYEAITFRCGHTMRRLIKYCHYARNDPNHECLGAWSVARSFTMPNDDCPPCVSARVDAGQGGHQARQDKQGGTLEIACFAARCVLTCLPN
ncbi:hypothetical protein BJ546DRAFT_127192 [Cryomyces antarcticus]